LIQNFEKALAEEAQRKNVDGIICGHIYHAALKEMDEIGSTAAQRWLNKGDGRLEIISWIEVMKKKTKGAGDWFGDWKGKQKRNNDD